jgi:hypothetical protein
MVPETVGDNCLLRSAGKKPSSLPAFSNSDLLSHDSLQSGTETTESIFKQLTTSENPELVYDLDGCGPLVLLVLRG